jgi:transposase-like protein
MVPILNPSAQPPHCPNPECQHYDFPRKPNWFQKAGSYSTLAFGEVPRFYCNSCGKYFSTQTFSIDYYSKKLVNYRYVYNQINAGAGIRNIARDLEVRDSTVTNRIQRLSRNALILHQMIVDHLPPSEDLVIDGLQNFCVSQYFPDNYTLVVGKDSQFAYDCDYATLRRCGRMTEDQKKRREDLEKTERADPKAIKFSFLRLLQGIDRKLKERRIPLILYTDEKKVYQRALWDKRIGFDSQMFEGLCRHHTTNSKDARNQKNPLFRSTILTGRSARIWPPMPGRRCSFHGTCATRCCGCTFTCSITMCANPTASTTRNYAGCAMPRWPGRTWSI